MKKATSLAVFLGVFAAQSSFAEAEFKLKVHHFLPPMSMAHQEFLVPWAEKVERESNGRIDVEVFPAMQLGGKPPQLFDQVRKGVADVVWTVGGYTPGRFPKTTVFELPFMPTNAKATSMAIQEFAETESADEFKDVHLLSLFTHAPGVLHSRDKAITTISDLKGLKLRAPNKIMSDGFSLNGSNTVFMPVTEMPSALSKGVLDVAALPYEVVLPLKIYELVGFHTEIKGDRGLYTNFNIFAMNKDVYEKMPSDLQKVIDNNSGVSYAGHLGVLWDNYELHARKVAIDNGNAVNVIEGEEYNKWKTSFAPIREEWSKEMTSNGYQAEALIDKAEELIKKYESMN